MISSTRFNISVEINRQARLAAEIARAQAEISTGKKILAPSDDPVGAARVGEIARAQTNEAAWLRNIDTATALSDRADTALTSLAALYDRASELILRAASGTTPADGRATIAAELRGLALDIATIRDSRDPRGEPLFRTADVLQIPVSEGVTVAAVASRTAVFDGVATANGLRDLATIVDEAADAALEPDPALRQAAVDASIGAVNAGLERIAAARGEQGVRGGRLDGLRERLLDSRLQLTEQRAVIEGTDVTEVVARLEAKRLSLAAAQAVFARVNQNTLFDLLR